MKKLGRFLLMLARELADENAYVRYLEARGLVHSPAEWQRFLEVRLRAKYNSAKCC